MTFIGVRQKIDILNFMTNPFYILLNILRATWYSFHNIVAKDRQDELESMHVYACLLQGSRSRP